MITDTEQIVQDAKRAAEHEVMGFILHDRKDYEGAGRHFGEGYAIIDSHRPKHMRVGEERARKAGKHKIKVLRAYDGIVENHTTTPYAHSSVEQHPNYALMVHHAIHECEELGLPPDYGLAKVQWYRTHADWVKPLTGTGIVPNGVDHSFVPDLMKAEQVFVTALTENEDLHERTLPLFVKCVISHDNRRIHGLEEHSPESIEAMTATYTEYLTHLFEQMRLIK